MSVSRQKRSNRDLLPYLSLNGAPLIASNIPPTNGRLQRMEMNFMNLMMKSSLSMEQQIIMCSKNRELSKKSQKQQWQQTSWQERMHYTPLKSLIKIICHFPSFFHVKFELGKNGVIEFLCRPYQDVVEKSRIPSSNFHS